MTATGEQYLYWCNDCVAMTGRPRRAVPSAHATSKFEKGGSAGRSARPAPCRLRAVPRADRLQRQKGNRTDRGLRNPARGKLAGALGREAQGVIFERLVRDPAIVFATDGDDALACRHA